MLSCTHDNLPSHGEYETCQTIPHCLVWNCIIFRYMQHNLLVFPSMKTTWNQSVSFTKNTKVISSECEYFINLWWAKHGWGGQQTFCTLIKKVFSIFPLCPLCFSNIPWTTEHKQCSHRFHQRHKRIVIESEYERQSERLRSQKRPVLIISGQESNRTLNVKEKSEAMMIVDDWWWWGWW